MGLSVMVSLNVKDEIVLMTAKDPEAEVESNERTGKRSDD